MSSKNTFWWISLAIWAAGSVWWHTCKIKQLCDDPLIPEATVQSAHTTISPLLITDGASLSLTSPGNFGFAKSGANVNLSAVRAEIDSLASYLRANPVKKVTITGYYSAEETNHSKWPDLGIARAESIKEYYVSLGLPAEKFVTRSELKTDLQFASDSLHGGIDFSFPEFPANERELAEAQKYEGIFKPLDLYFNSGSSSYIQTTDNQKFIDEAKKYLAANKDKKLLLTGHTDNTGNEAGNQALSKKRAEQAQKQLISAGLPASQLVTDAKGQSQPKQTNDTPEGRAANRRVEIVVQ